MRRRPDVTPFLAGLVALALLCTGCATNPRHQLAVSSQVVASSLFAAQDAEDAAYLARKCATPGQTGCITPEAHRRFNQHLVVALTLGKEFNAAVRVWDPQTLEDLTRVHHARRQF